jgi:hypothetical protein
MTRTDPLPTRGSIVRVRQRQHLVEDLVPPARPGDCHLVRIACLDDDAQGRQAEVLWEMEADAEVLTSSGWEHLAAKGFDPPRHFSA